MAGGGVEFLPKEYGYVALVLVLYCFLNFWMASQVGKARRKYAFFLALFSSLLVKFFCIISVTVYGAINYCILNKTLLRFLHVSPNWLCFIDLVFCSLLMHIGFNVSCSLQLFLILWWLLLRFLSSCSFNIGTKYSIQRCMLQKLKIRKLSSSTVFRFAFAGAFFSFWIMIKVFIPLLFFSF